MARLPQLSGRVLGRVVLRLGFRFESQKGSHMKFSRVHPHGKEVLIIPDHKIIRKGTLHGILKRLNLNAEAFKNMLL